MEILRRNSSKYRYSIILHPGLSEESRVVENYSRKLLMQLYHHPYSLDSQRVRLALEEKGIDYTSFHANPLTGKNLDSPLFRMNPSGKLPVFQNGSHVICQTLDIMRYIDSLKISNPNEDSHWLEKINDWDPKIFTLSHVPEKYRLFISRFVRRVIIARMTEAPDLACLYHDKLRDAYEIEEKLKDPERAKQSEQKLCSLLDDAEAQLERSNFLSGEDYTIVDSMFIPVLARISLLNLDRQYIDCRPKIAQYYEKMKHRPSYKVAIGRYFNGWRKHGTLWKTLFCVYSRNLLKRF